jgi:hypothetical protein
MSSRSVDVRKWLTGETASGEDAPAYAVLRTPRILQPPACRRCRRRQLAMRFEDRIPHVTAVRPTRGRRSALDLDNRSRSNNAATHSERNLPRAATRRHRLAVGVSPRMAREAIDTAAQRRHPLLMPPQMLRRCAAQSWRRHCFRGLAPTAKPCRRSAAIAERGVRRVIAERRHASGPGS